MSAGRKSVKARASAKVFASSDLKFDDDWKKSSVPVHLASLFGWVIPSASPCPAFEDNASLFKVFSDRIADNLAHFPQGPAADDKIWLYMLTWHMGLFACMMLGQIVRAFSFVSSLRMSDLFVFQSRRFVALFVRVLTVSLLPLGFTRRVGCPSAPTRLLRQVIAVLYPLGLRFVADPMRGEAS